MAFISGRHCGRIYKNVSINALDYIYLILASIIASCGFLIDSETTIIGSMLISSLLKPIFLLAYYLRSKKYRQMDNVLIHFVVMTMIIIGIGYVIGKSAVYIDHVNEKEIKESKTLENRRFLNIENIQSNYYWVIAVALACGLILAITSVYEPGKYTSVMTGAAISASILPPFIGSGLELAMGNTTHAFNTFMLGFINIVAIFVAYVFSHFLICND